MKTLVYNFMFVILFILSPRSSAQQSRPSDRGCHIEGYVRDRVTGQPIPDVYLLVVGTYKGDRTDDSGHYCISGLYTGMYSIQASAIGYLDERIDSIAIVDSTITRINFSIRDWCEPYADSAKQDLQNGIIRMLYGGGLIILVTGASELAYKYGFEYTPMGCNFWCTEPYNNVVWQYLEQKHGTGWRQKFEKELDELYNNRLKNR